MSDDEKLIDDDVEVGGGEDEEKGSDGGEGEGEEGEGAERSVDSSEEEEDEAQNEYEKDGFIVDEEEEEGDGDESDEDRVVKKKKKKKRTFELDEDDYALLEEHEVQVKRPTGRKRLKSKGEGERKERYTAAEEMKEALFGSDEELEDELEDRRAARATREERAHAEEEFHGDEMDDFIVDEDGGAGRRRRNALPSMPGVSDDAMQDAMDIFGNVEDLLDLYQDARIKRGVDEEGDVEEELEVDEGEDEGELDEEAGQERERKKQEVLRQKMLKKALRHIDPETVAAHHLLPLDQLIKERDVPERLQLLGRTLEAGIDYTAAAEWIYDQLFSDKAPKRLAKELVEGGVVEEYGSVGAGGLEYQPGELKGATHVSVDLHNRMGVRQPRAEHQISQWRIDEAVQTTLKEAIARVLTLLYTKYEEVPLLGMYRKEDCGELLAMRLDDAHEVTGERNVPRHGKDNLWPTGTVQPQHRRIRRFDVLYAVLEQSLRYSQLVRTRTRLSGNFEKLRELLNSEGDTAALDSCLSLLESAQTLESVEDIARKFELLLQGQSEAALASLSLDSRRRRPQRVTAYKQHRAAGLSEFVEMMGLTAAQFAENIEDVYMKNTVIDPKEEPEEAARQFLMDRPLAGYGISTPEQLIKAATNMAATELANEPGVRGAVREMFYRNALLYTTPTSEGENRIDPTDKYGAIKRIREKPLQKFEGSDQFLRIVTAAQEGLVKYEIKVPVTALNNDILDELRGLYLSDAVATIAQHWNVLRKNILDTAVLELMIPQLEQEFKAKLLQDAREVALQRVGESFWSIVSKGPMRISSAAEEGTEDADDYTESVIEHPRYMAVVWGEGNPPTVAVQLDGHGNLVDLVMLGQLSGNTPRSEVGARYLLEDPNKSRDLTRLKEKITDHAPNAILVGASVPQCKQLYADMEALRDYILDAEVRFLRERMENHTILVRYVHDRIASLWQNCEAAKKEFPEQPAQVRRAIALGRMQLDPLAVIASLCGHKQEIMSLSLYDLQSALQPEEIIKVIEQTMVTAVNQVGVHLNVMACVPWRAAPLQYVCGLGPRKAAALLQGIQRNNNTVDGRMLLYKGGLDLLGKVVFRNASPFLRVSVDGLAHLTNIDIRTIDNSRIHPESYRLAVKFAQFILQNDEADPDMVMEPANKGKAAKCNVEEFADLEGMQNQLAKLIDMQMEMLAPYADIRIPDKDLTDKEVWLLLHGESEQSLREGRLVEVRVKWVGDRVRCTLTQSEMEAVILKENFSVQFESFRGPSNEFDLRRRTQVGDVFLARVRGLVREEDSRFGVRYVVDLTTRSDDLGDASRWERKYCEPVEPHYHILSKSEIEEKRMTEKTARTGPTKTFISRPIKHPLFENIDFRVAADKLNETTVPVGACLFRPARKQHGQRAIDSLQKITLCIKLAQGVISTVDVLESEKKGQMSVKLQAPLKIKISGPKRAQRHGHQGATDEEVEYMVFEDLDEIVATYAEPLVGFVNELVTHRKFKPGLKLEVEEALRKERAVPNPPPIVYCLGMSPDRAGWGYIAFTRSGNSIYREYFDITPKGFYFRGMKHFTNLEKLLAVFKNEYDYILKKQKEGAGMLGYSAPSHYMPGAPYGAPGAYGGPGMPYGAMPMAPVPYYGQPQPYGMPGGGYGVGPTPYGAPGMPQPGAYGQRPGGYVAPQQGARWG